MSLDQFLEVDLIADLKARDREIENKVKNDPQYLIQRGYCPLQIADYAMHYYRRDNK